MKNREKIAFLLVLFLVGVPVFSVRACSPEPGAIAPTSQSVIKAGGNVVVGTIVATGDVVVGKVLERKQGTSYDYVVMISDKTSCGTHPDAFSVGEFFVAITPQGNSFIIEHLDFDSQFTLFYRTLFEAQQGAEQIMRSVVEIPLVTAGATTTTTATPTENLNTPTSYVPVGYSLKPGMKSEEVRLLQAALKKVTGITLEKVDGSYGPKTAEAVKQFQAMKKLVVDGLAGIKTQNALRDHFTTLAPVISPTQTPTTPLI